MTFIGLSIVKSCTILVFRRDTWKCPICNVEISFDNLIIDELFQEIIQQAESDEIMFEDGLSWKPINKTEASKNG